MNFDFHKYFKFSKEPKLLGENVVLFCTIDNEYPLVKYFLEHYRCLGIRQFYFLVDKKCNDGTEDFLLSQDDCSVLKSSLAFDDKIQLNFNEFKSGPYYSAGAYFKFIIPHCLFKNKWVLTADSDEFLVLPPKNSSIQCFTEYLSKNSLEACKGIMVDMFPKSLNLLSENYDRHPEKVCKYFNPPKLNWEGTSKMPQKYDYSRDIRTRMYEDYKADSSSDNSEKYEFPLMSKIPLVFWRDDTFANAHWTNNRFSPFIQIAFRHFYFNDKLESKLTKAIAVKQHYRSSMQYKPVYHFFKKHRDKNLIEEHTSLFSDQKSFYDRHLVFNKLKK